MPNSPDIITQPEQKEPRSFDELLKEYDEWKKLLPEKERNQLYLWERFLLEREDDGSNAFVRAIEATLWTTQIEIARIVQDAVREGNIEQRLPEITTLATIANALSDRLNCMLGEYNHQTKKRRRIISEPLKLPNALVDSEPPEPLVDIVDSKPPEPLVEIVK